MSEDSKTNKVTAVEKSEKAKDPKKVELGKKLAKISKEAKERKARQRESERREREAELERKVDLDDRSLAEEINDYVDFRYIVGGVTIVAALGGLYYAYKSDKRLDRERSEAESDRSEVSSDEVLRAAGPAQQRKDKKVNIINKNDYEITKCNPPTSKSCIENL